MDQELIEYLDHRFNQFRNELLGDLREELRSDVRDGLRSEIRGEIAVSAAETRSTLREEIVASAAETRSTLREEIAASAAETRSTLREEIAASAVETRRHFDVVAERLMGKIQLVGEGVIGVDQKVDRLAVEMRSEFQKVDRRLLHLQARVIGRD